MLARLWGWLCPRCLRNDGAPVAQHPTLVMMQRTEGRLDHLLAMTAELLGREELDPRESGNWSRDMMGGSYGEGEQP